MKVSEVIHWLKQLPQTDEIAVAWWTKDLFGKYINAEGDFVEFPQESWEFAVDDFDKEHGYAAANELVYYRLLNAMNNTDLESHGCFIVGKRKRIDK
ncbi:MAG: hypothetical protein FJ267_18515 [Planctomycetes bacterium]|nr:hypothetical protein [Planctomycetota bacterium]